MVQQPEPVILSGSPDESLSRWLLLFRWLLRIPHYIVLAVLLFIGIVLGIIAFLSILFIGKYPRGIFDFASALNVRYYWRMGYVLFFTHTYAPSRLDIPSK